MAAFVMVNAGTPITFTQGGNGQGTSSAGVGTQSFAGVSIGAADPTRFVIAFVNVTGGTAGGATAVSIGGVAATRVARQASTNIAWDIWIAAVPSGATATLSITTTVAGSNFTTEWIVYSIYGGSSSTPAATGTAIGSPMNAGAISVGVGGIILAGAISDAAPASIAWSGVTQDSFVAPLANWRISVAVLQSGVVQSPSVSGDFAASPADQTLVVASWNP